MDKDIALKFTDKIARQRNLFLAISLLSLSSTTLLSLKLLTKQERTILVPGLSSEVWVEGGRVSASYIAEDTPRFLHSLLDLNKEIIDHNAIKIMQHISQSDPVYMRNIGTYFAEKAEEYKRFNLTTFFTEKTILPDPREMSAVVHGTLSTIFSDNTRLVKPASYKLTYEWIGGRGRLKLKEFIRIKSEEEQSNKLKEQERKQEKIDSYKQDGNR